MREKYAGISSYCYTLNNPVKLIDPNGMSPTDDHFDQHGNYLYTDNKKTNNIVIDMLYTEEIQLKDFHFDKQNVQTLMNIGNYYAKKAGVDVNSLHGKSVSVAMWNDQVYEAGAPDREKGEFTTYNGGEYCYDCLMQTNKEKKIISLRIVDHKTRPLLNDKYNFISVLQHEGGATVPSHLSINIKKPIDFSPEGQRNEHLKIYDYQIDKSPIFKNTTLTFQQLMRSNYQDVKDGSTGNL
jgi:hypothetical protein